MQVIDVISRPVARIIFLLSEPTSNKDQFTLLYVLVLGDVLEPNS